MGSRNQRNVGGSSGLGCVGIHDVGVQVSVSGRGGGGYSRDCGSPGDGFSFTALLVNISDSVGYAIRIGDTSFILFLIEHLNRHQ